MTKQSRKEKSKEDELVEVHPVQRFKNSGNNYVYEYHYEYIDVDVIREDRHISMLKNGDLYYEEDYVVWRSDGKPDIYLDERKCYRKAGTDKKEAQKNCFVALSYLNKQGYVSFWSKL